VNARNVVPFLGALALIWGASSFLGALWHSLVVEGHRFTLYGGWFSVLPLLRWLFLFVFFLAVGTVTALIVRQRTAVHWAMGLGVAYSLVELGLSRFGAASGASLYAYVGYYGSYLMPPMGALAGALIVMQRGAA